MHSSGAGVPRPPSSTDGGNFAARRAAAALFDTAAPDGETRNLIAQHPDIAERLLTPPRRGDATLKTPGLPTETHPRDQVFFDAHVEKKPPPPSAEAPAASGKRNAPMIARLWSSPGRPYWSVTAAPPARPNLVFILADVLGWSDTTFDRPNAFYETPNIQRLAQRGMRFTQAYSANPLCSPRASILSGLHSGSLHHRARLPPAAGDRGKSPVRNAAPTARALVPEVSLRYPLPLAEAFKAAGYATGHFGKWHRPSPTARCNRVRRRFPLAGPRPRRQLCGAVEISEALKVARQPGEHRGPCATEAIAFISNT